MSVLLRSVGLDRGDTEEKGKGDLGAIVAAVGEVIVGTERMSLGRVVRSILVDEMEGGFVCVCRLD